MHTQLLIPVNDEQFLCFFEKFGEVIDSVVMVDRHTKRSRGFGFVTFADQVRQHVHIFHSVFSSWRCPSTPCCSL